MKQGISNYHAEQLIFSSISPFMYSYPTTFITALRIVINYWLSSPSCRFFRFS